MAWDLLILATVLSFTFLITYRMVFQTFQADLFYYSLNFLFFLDMAAGFATKVKEGHRRIETFRDIRDHYLKTWFAVDLVSFFPFELIPVAIFGGIPQGPLMFQVYLGLQGLTLVKVLKAVRLFSELTEALALSPAVRRLASFGYWFVQAIHLMALGWVLIGGAEAARPHYDQYLRSFYWVTTIIVQIFGVGMYTFVIANVSSLVSNLDVARSSYQRHLEEVNACLKGIQATGDLQERVRDYSSYLFEQKKSVQSRTTLEELPPSLGLEILMHQNRGLLEKVGVLAGADELFIREAVQKLRPRVFLPREFIVHQGEVGDAMYFLTSGEAEVSVGGETLARLGAGSVFGEAALVTDERRNASVQAVSYGTGYQLMRQDFGELRTKYPEFDARVRKIAEDRKKGPSTPSR